MSRWLQILLKRQQPLRFARYRPAPRLGTRRLEHRMLRSLYGNLSPKRLLSS